MRTKYLDNLYYLHTSIFAIVYSRQYLRSEWMIIFWVSSVTTNLLMSRVYLLLLSCLTFNSVMIVTDIHNCIVLILIFADLIFIFSLNLTTSMFISNFKQTKNVRNKFKNIPHTYLYLIYSYFFRFLYFFSNFFYRFWYWDFS